MNIVFSNKPHYTGIDHHKGNKNKAKFWNIWKNLLKGLFVILLAVCIKETATASEIRLGDPFVPSPFNSTIPSTSEPTFVDWCTPGTGDFRNDLHTERSNTTSSISGHCQQIGALAESAAVPVGACNYCENREETNYAIVMPPIGSLPTIKTDPIDSSHVLGSPFIPSFRGDANLPNSTQELISNVAIENNAEDSLTTPNRYYSIINSGSESQKCLGAHVPDMHKNGGRVQIWSCNGMPEQLWRFDGKSIVNAGGKCLDARPPDRYNQGGKIQVWECNGTLRQQWRVDGNRLINADGLCLNVFTPGRNSNGGRVQVWECNQSKEQIWTIN